MKKLIATTLVSTLVGLAAYAQGTINFGNFVPGSPAPLVNAKIFQSDGSTALSGSTYMAGLLAGSAANNMSILATAPFLTGGGAGYIASQSVAVPGVAFGANAFVVFVAWNTANGATFAAAQGSGANNAWGWSNGGVPFQIATGGGGSPPAVASPIAGLTTFHLNAIPEPSTFALAGLGAAALMFFRRRM